jgi:hypothetical protein
MLELEFSVRATINIHPALRVGYSARDLDLPQLMCPSWSAPEDLPRLAPQESAEMGGGLRSRERTWPTGQTFCRVR